MSASRLRHRSSRATVGLTRGCRRKRSVVPSGLIAPMTSTPSQARVSAFVLTARLRAARRSAHVGSIGRTSPANATRSASRLTASAHSRDQQLPVEGQAVAHSGVAPPECAAQTAQPPELVGHVPTGRRSRVRARQGPPVGYRGSERVVAARAARRLRLQRQALNGMQRGERAAHPQSRADPTASLRRQLRQRGPFAIPG